MTSPSGHAAIVLMYHRVFAPALDPWRLSVSPQRFEEHMALLRRDYTPVSLAKLASAAGDGCISPGMVAVTFDDGYADVLDLAAPVLERYEIPATAFLVSGYISSERAFWWDELETLLLTAGELPPILEMTVNQQALRWDLGSDATYDESAFNRNRAWRAWGEPDPSSRQTVFREVWEVLQGMQNPQREAALSEIRAWSRQGRPARVSERFNVNHRLMDSDDVAALARTGLIDIGAHSSTHATLSKLPIAEQRDEIMQSKAALESMVGRPVTSFAYPYGRPEDYTPDTVQLVRDAGFARACSNFEGVVRHGAQRFQLPRLNILDIAGPRFASRLAHAFRLP